jgi:hypothetical protein
MHLSSNYIFTHNLSELHIFPSTAIIFRHKVHNIDDQTGWKHFGVRYVSHAKNTMKNTDFVSSELDVG